MSLNEESVFAQALEIQNPQERAAFLERACAGNPGLRQSVASLLSAYDAGEFLEAPVVAPVTTIEESPLIERPGTVIGQYKLLEPVGEGGFGVVFMAEQFQPIRRKVALKVLKPGMDTRQVVARFEAERQVLALMDHPNIAKVLDGGETSSGRPYFVMELVRGIPITDFCDQNQLPTRQRLELFIAVCQAVQHAHQKGIIHRDLKPTNVLVTLHDGTPVVKVIDFGVAKALGQPLTDKTLFTGFAQLVGTPLYMSPEQAELSGLDVDTRSDIYALGVLLYELLTGATPFDKERLKKAAFDEVRRIIREEEPPRPSTRVSTLGKEATSVSAQRKSDPRGLRQLLRGELDWIVMKCLEKDRTRRYATANGLAQDIRNHLADEPVEACPPSVGYRFRKFARRHKTALTAVTLVAAALVLGTAISVGQAIRATRAEALAGERLEAEKAGHQAAAQARADEEAQRRRAEQLAEENRQGLYAAQINLAQQAWEAGDLARARELLDGLRPGPGQDDLRGFEWYYLWRLCHSERLRLATHRGPVRAVAFAPDGRTAVTAGNDGTVRFHDAATGQERRVLVAHAAPVGAVAVSRDGRTLATAGGDHLVKLWDAGTGQERATLRGHAEQVSCLAFSPDGALLAAGTAPLATGTGNPRERFVRGGQGEIKLWDVAARVERATLREHQGGVLSLAFTPDGQKLASAGVDGRVKVWNMSEGRPQVNLPGSGAPLFAIAFAPDGRTLAVGGGNPYEHAATLRLWDLVEGREKAVLGGHHGPVFALAFAPDGGTLATAGYDQIVRLWDVASGREKARLRGHADVVWSLAFAPDSRTLATASWDGTAKLWDATRPRQECDVLARKKPSESTSYHVAFSPDSKLLVTAGRVVRLWDVEAGQDRGPLPGYGSGDVSAIFSPDGRVVAAAGIDGLVKLWDVATRRERAELRGHRDKVWSLAFASDSKTLATGSADRTVRLWDVPTGKERLRFDAHGDNVRSMAFTPDGRTLATASSDGVRLWDVATGAQQAAISNEGALVAVSPDGRTLAWGGPHIRLTDLATRRERAVLRGHTATVYQLAFSPDGRTLATASWDGTVKLWHVATGQQMLTLPSAAGVTWSAAFSPDGRTLAMGSGGSSTDNEVTLWRAASREEAARAADEAAADAPLIASRGRLVKDGNQIARTLRGHTDNVTSAVFSPDGRLLASGSGTLQNRPGEVKVWETATGREVFTLRDGIAAVWGVAFHPGGERLAAASRDGTVRVWDLQSGKQLLTLRGHGGPVLGVTFSPDGTRIASASEDATVKVWDAATGKELLTLVGHSGPVRGVAFSPDGARLASSSADHAVKLWDATSGKELRTLRGHAEYVFSVAFRPDGRRIVSASRDGSIRVWDPDGGEVLALRGMSWVTSVGYSRDGLRLASACVDRSVRVWDATSGKELLSFQDPASKMRTVAFSPDGNLLALACEDQTVKLWDVMAWPEESSADPPTSTK